jgi:hypothetical protein
MRPEIVRAASAALLSTLLTLPGPAQQGAATAQQPAQPCAGPEIRQFDFWIGEWNLVSRVRAPDKDVWTEEKGTDSVRPVLNGCALLQEWNGTVGGQPLHGMSLTSWLPRSGEWQQAWSDDSGPNLLVFKGKMEDGRMVLTREVVVDGKTVLRRQVFQNIQPASMDWVYEQSTDGGKTWTPTWKIHYSRKP